MGVDSKIDAVFQPVSEAIFSVLFYGVPLFGAEAPLILLWLVAAAAFFTFYLGFVNFRYFFHGVDVVRGKYDDKKDDGQISSFQALMTSMSGTVGLGNIAGVAVAVTVGGPGAVFWMIIMGFLGMSTKFAEVTLGVKYRQHASKEHPERISGGPMHYLRDGFANRGSPNIGKILAIWFAVFCVGGAIGGGSMFQANQAFQQVFEVTGGAEGFMAGKGWMFGVFMAFLTGIVIIGGIKSIADVASKLVPLMALIYLAAGLVVLGVHLDALPGALGTILSKALSLEAGLGGLIGGLLVGVQRAAFSNEAGLGTAAILYAAARARHPVTQGMASMLGPFIDTVVICTMTGLVIIVSGAYESGNGMEGVELTSRAMATGLSWFPYVLALSVFLFAYSTLITWSYYVVKCTTFIFGEKDSIELIVKLLYCLCAVIGCAATLDNVINFMDGLILMMAVPNIIGLYFLAPEIKRELKDYLANLKTV